MRIEYYRETDTLYIELRPEPGADAREIAPGVVIDLGPDGNPVGIEIDPAGTIVDTTRLETNLELRAIKPTRATA